MTAPDIEDAAVVGDVFIDLVTRVEVIPTAGSGVWGTPLISSGGGCGGNMAAALAALGVPTRFLTVVGDDPYGSMAIEQLDAAGVDTSTIIIDGEAGSGAVIILIDAQNERTIIPCALGGAFEKLRVEHLQGLLADPPKHLLITGVALGADPVGETYLHLARHVPADTTLYFDPNLRQPASTVTEELAGRFQEISRLADVVMAGVDEIAALGLQRRDGQAFITKASAQGSTLTDPEGVTTHIPAITVPVADSTGAGDAFAAGFIAARARRHSLLEAAGLAAAAGAIAVQSLGARVPTTWDQLIDLHPHRPSSEGAP